MRTSARGKGWLARVKPGHSIGRRRQRQLPSVALLRLRLRPQSPNPPWSSASSTVSKSWSCEFMIILVVRPAVGILQLDPASRQCRVDRVAIVSSWRRNRRRHRLGKPSDSHANCTAEFPRSSSSLGFIYEIDESLSRGRHTNPTPTLQHKMT